MAIARVPKFFPRLPLESRLFVGRPSRGTHFAAEEQAVNHILGAQLSLVHKCAYGPAEPDTAVRRFLWQAHPNARNLVLAIVPFGYPSGPTFGEVTDFQIGGVSQDGVPQRIDDAQADLSTLDDIPWGSVMQCILVGEGTPGALQEVAWQTTDLRPHSVLAYEVRRTHLIATNEHVDRSISDPTLFISDDDDATGNRGQKAMLQAIETARANGRRHIISMAFGQGASENAGVFTTLYTPLFCRARAFYKGETESPTRAFFYVGSVGGGSTHEIRIRDAGTSDTGSVTGVNATGWWPDPTGGISAGVSFSMTNNAWDEATIDSKTTAGAGSLRVDSVCVIDE